MKFRHRNAEQDIIALSTIQDVITDRGHFGSHFPAPAMGLTFGAHHRGE